jgi:NAD(P)-dependent dehydrogenase (short-subunit alcohol dehydrogenase family)
MTMNNPFDLSGQVAIVTGGSRGLGKEMATALAQAGADLVIGSRNVQELNQASAQIIESSGRQVLACELDVTSRESVEGMVAQAMAKFGRIDILVNNAGVNVRAPLEEVRDEDWHRMQAVNVTGALFCCRAVVPHMRKARYGRIINMASAVALVGLPGRVGYTASKGALLQMTRTLSAELAPAGITVNAICPGPFLTEINRPLLDNPAMLADILGRVPMARWGELREIRPAVLFLSCRDAGYVTGAIISVDGGWSAQ